MIPLKTYFISGDPCTVARQPRQWRPLRKPVLETAQGRQAVAVRMGKA